MLNSLRVPSAPRSRRPAPRLEVLEDRTLPSASVAENFFPTQNNVSFIDKLYLIHEAQGDQQEMILGQLASRASNNAAVQWFGQVLFTDHQNAFNDIKTVLQDAGLPVPSLSLQNIQNIQQFNGLTG